MFGLQELSIDFLTDTPFLVAISLIILLALSIYLYRRTNPPLPMWMRIVLGGLRIAAVVTLFLALFEPVISYTREYVRPRRVAVVIDESLSMDRVENEKSRRVRTDSLLSSQTFENLQRTAQISTYYFGGGLAQEPDAVDSTRTALGDALYELDRLQMGEPHDYWLLLSDGNSNAGRKPVQTASGLPTPVVAVDITGGQGSFDIGIDDIEYNPVVFADQPTEIKVKLNWRGAEGRTASVQLVDSNRTITVEQLSITQEGGRGEVTLKYTPEEPGQKLLKIDIPAQENEETPGNNERSFAVKVLKSRLLVLMVAAEPDYEVGFVKRLLDASDRYDVELAATGPRAGNLSGRIPGEQTELNRYDLVILYDPDPGQLGARENLLRSYLTERGGAIWVMMGTDYAQRGPVEWFDNLLPFYQSSPQPIRRTEFRVEPLESHLFHPAIRLADNQSSIREAWASLPPFESLVWCDQIHPEGVLLAEASIRATQGLPPALGYRRHGPGKLFATTVLPFWPWGFVNLGFGEDASHYRTFVESTVGWLTTRDDADPIQVKPEKEVFTRGEPVVFNGFAYDLGYRPLPGVSGTIELSGGPDNDTFEQDLVAEGDGTFNAVFENTAPGRYTFAAEMTKDGQLLKADSGQILIEEFSLEEFDQGGDPATLAALAQTTGGNYYTYENFGRILDDLQLSEVTVTSRQEVVFWNKLWMLLLLIGALSAEWLLRKMNQLV